MSTLILGASSFSGANFLKHMIQTDNIIIATFRNSSDDVFKQISPKANRKNIISYPFNLNQDASDLIELVSKHKIKNVINFAAQSMVGQSWEYPEDWYEANVVSMAKLLNKLRTVSSIERFIQFTTPEVYGSTQGWIKESFAFNPSTPYATSRAAGDWHLRNLFDQYDFPVIFTRTANVYGPQQQLYRIIPKAILYGLTREKIELHGGGKSVRSFIYSDDVSNALIRIFTTGTLGNTYHISTNKLITVRDLISLIFSKLNIDVNEFLVETSERPGKDAAYQLDSTKIRSELKWQDSVDLDNGLDSTITWVKNNLESLRTQPSIYKHRK